MWIYLVRIILRYRVLNLIIIGLLTGFMIYKATQVKLSYEYGQMLPPHDSTRIKYEQFLETFGADARVLFIAIENERIFDLKVFNEWYDLTEQIRKTDGVEGVISLSRIFHLTRNDTANTLDFDLLVKEKPKSQEELDSLRELIFSLPFYDQLLYNKETNATLMGVTLNKDFMNSKARVKLVFKLQETFEEFSEKNNIDVHFSGLPYIRTKVSKKIEDELWLFIILALTITSLILFFFFRSFKAVLYPLIIVIICVIWVFGIISLFDFRITLLTGIIPPLLIVIVVENSIFLLNKYHAEFRSHGNKMKSLSRTVQRIGNANLLTNATTAAGFAAFIVTGNKVLIEFGVVASLNILAAYLLTLFLIPIFFSFVSPPRYRHVRHLDKSAVGKVLDHIVKIVQKERRIIYIVSTIALVLGIAGVTMLDTTGRIVDDIPKKDPLYADLLFMEKHFKGVMPLEISIDTKEEDGIFANNGRALYKMRKLQRTLEKDTSFSNYLSRPISIIEGISFVYQAHRGGDPKYYVLPPPSRLAQLRNYTFEQDTGQNIFKTFIDSTNRVTRISLQMANVSTNKIEMITDSLRPVVDDIFPPDEYQVNITGSSITFMEGTHYLVKNLLTSLVLAVVVISVLMALLFTSVRMVLISLVPNILPQILTAALMGFIGISVKPSTILIFSIALGISVDNAIHFLSRYRLHLKQNNWDIKSSVLEALKETGYSMIYSSVVLFFGFIIFTLSSFGGTETLGYLVAFTLIMAMLSNLFLLPSLLLSLDKRITTKSFEMPFLEIFDEEEDIELEELEIDTRGSA